MEFDPVLIARLQFAFTITFHIIFPTFTIGLSAYIATLLVMATVTGRERLQRLAQFWTRIFAVSFAMGVVSGIVLAYQFGTNWSRFSVFAGNVIGPLIGYEILTAFFLEATFLGVMLFGWGRVPMALQVFSSIMVAIGTVISAFWILAANSWMQTPAGHQIVDGIAVPLDWWDIIFNPSFGYRFAHMLNAAYLTAAFVVLGVGARYLRADRHPEQARTMMRMAIGLLAILAPLQVLLGDLHGLNTLKHQPIKIAAIEGHWDTFGPGNFHVFAWPDEQAEENRFAISIPQGASLILTHRLNGQFLGLKEVPPQERPPVKTPFFAFRVMLAAGFFMVAAALVGAWLMWRGVLFETRWYLRIAANTWWVGFVAVIAGWLVSESGRQPWVVHRILRTADAISPVTASTVATSLALFIAVYGIVFVAGIYYINRLIAKGPQARALEPPAALPARPLSAAPDAGREALASRG